MRFVPTRRMRSMVVLAAAAMVASLAAPPFAPAGALPGSTFDEKDGNLVVDGNETDWASFKNNIDCVAGIGCGTDLVKSNQDDGYGQGSKDDHPTLTLVNQQVPPSKTDLEAAYVATETVGNNVFMYFSWVRSNNNGTTNFSIELNENLPTVAGNKQTFDRKNARLITWDFEGGGSTVQLAAYRWLGPGDPAACEKASSKPCWGDRKDLDASGFAAGSVNQPPFNNAASVSDPIRNKTLPAGTFGEAAVNMTAANLLGACGGLGSVTVRSRSSSSFGSELKDTIGSFKTAAEVPVDMSQANVNGTAFGRQISLKDKGVEKIPAALSTASPAASSTQTGPGENGNVAGLVPIEVPTQDQQVGSQTIKKGGLLSATLLQTLAQSKVVTDPPAATQVSRAALVDLKVLRDGIDTEHFKNTNPVVAADAVTAEAVTEATPDSSTLLPNGSGLVNLNLWGAAKGSSNYSQVYELDQFGAGSRVEVLMSSADSGISPLPGQGKLGDPVNWQMNQTVRGIYVFLKDINKPAELAWQPTLAEKLQGTPNPFADGDQTLEATIGYAEAHSNVPAILCNAPQAVAGHAYVLKAHVPGVITATHGFVSIPRTGGAATNSVGTVGVDVAGFTVATLSGGKTASEGDPSTVDAQGKDAAKAQSTASGGELCVLEGIELPGITNATDCLVKAKLHSVDSTSVASLAAKSATASFHLAQLWVADEEVPVGVLNQEVDLEVAGVKIGEVVVNEQIADPDSPGHVGKTVRALRITIDTPQLLDDLIATLQDTLNTDITIPGKVEVIVLEAHSGATFLPLS